MTAETRLQFMMLAAAHWNCERFRGERLAAIKYLGICAPDSEIVRRAAFWEIRDCNAATVGQAALRRLVASNAAANQLQLAAQLLADPDYDLLQEAEQALRKDHRLFANALAQCLFTHDDRTAEFVFLLLVYYWPDPTPLQRVLGWARSTDPALRKKASEHLDRLDWMHVPEAAQRLLKEAGYSRKAPK